MDFDVDRFLARPLVARVAALGPTVRPVWFLWEDGAFWWLTGSWSTLPSILSRDPKVAVVVDDCDLRTGETRTVTAFGRAEVVAFDADRARRKLARYLGDDEVMWDERFRSGTFGDASARFARLEPDRLVARDRSFSVSGVADELRWARELQSIAQTGVRYAERDRDHFDLERYADVARIATEMTASLAGTPFDEIEGLLASQTGDATPKVDVRGVVFDGDAILLVRETQDDGRWTLPGGWADVGEAPSKAVEREVLEESGYRVRASKLLALWDRDRHHRPGPFSTYKVFFGCELVGGEATDSHETSDARFFRQDELPADLSTGRVTRAQLDRMFEHLHRPDLPADFD